MENCNDLLLPAEQSPAKYIEADCWATLVAALWIKPHFRARFELDPVNAILTEQLTPEAHFNLGYSFDSASNPTGRRDRLIKIPANPGYSINDLNDACIGKITIVPMTSWTICGLSKPNQE